MSFVMHRDGEPAVTIPPEVEREAIEAGSDKPVDDYVAAYILKHPAEAKAAAKAFKSRGTPAEKATTTDAAPASPKEE